MKRYRITSDNGPTYTTWAYSARNALLAHRLHYRGPFINLTATELDS